MNSIKKNFIYNIIYQILTILLPLITLPYVSRILGSDGVGQYSYTYSIVYYFMIFAMLGLNNYGNRSIAKVRDDKLLLSKTFKEIYFMQIITSSLMIILYLFYIIFIPKKFYLISTIQFFYVLSCAFDINWFFFGLEKFKLTVVRNIIIKFLALISIFIFVKHSNDTWIYTLILSLSTLLSQILLWPFVKKYISNVKINFQDVKKHFKPCLYLTLPVIAVAIYKFMDKTMLGMMSNVSEVGFYENAEKIVNVPSVIMGALGTVMLPRMSNIYGKGKSKQGENLIEKSMSAMMFIGFPMVFGLISVSSTFTILFFGESFEKTGLLIKLLAITSIFVSWGNVIRTQYLIPKEKDKEYIISAFLGAFINLILNLLLIPKLTSVGACISTIIAELFVALYQTISVKDELPIKRYFVNSIQFFIKGFFMCILLYLLNKYVFYKYDLLYKLLFEIIVGTAFYLLLNLKYIYININIKLRKV